MTEPKVTDSFNRVFKDKQRVLIVAAHPDDNEVICGGLVARLCSEGKQVRLVVTTNGEKGTMDRQLDPKKLAKTRLQEQAKASKILGITPENNINLGVPDGELEASVANIGKIVYRIRQFKPDIVITHNPDEVINTFSSAEGVRWINHRDHRNTALITCDAVYPYSRDTAFFPDQMKQGLTPHTVLELLLSDSYEHPLRLYFDVTDYVDKKRQALLACPSVVDPKHVEGYIDELRIGDRYYEQLRYLSGLY